MKKEKKLEEIKLKILPILKENNIKKAGIFGSYARGENKKNSDIDVIIKPTKDMSLIDIVGIEIQIKKILRKKIDLITYRSLNPKLKNQILSEEVKIL